MAIGGGAFAIPSSFFAVVPFAFLSKRRAACHPERNARHARVRKDLLVIGTSTQRRICLSSAGARSEDLVGSPHRAGVRTRFRYSTAV